jgi:hypothetical protein
MPLDVVHIYIRPILVAHGYETPDLLTQVLAVYIINLYTGAILFAYVPTSFLE